MASDGERAQPSDDEMLPDERAVIAERAREIADLDEDDFLSAEAIAEALELDRD